MFLLIRAFVFSAFLIFLFNFLYFPSFGSTLPSTHTPFNLFSSISLEVLHPNFLANLNFFTCPFNLKSKVNGIFIFFLNTKRKLKCLGTIVHFASHAIVIQDINFNLIFFSTTKLNYIDNIFYIQYLFSFTHKSTLFFVWYSFHFLDLLLGFFSFSEEHHQTFL